MLEGSYEEANRKNQNQYLFLHYAYITHILFVYQKVQTNYDFQRIFQMQENIQYSFI